MDDLTLSGSITGLVQRGTSLIPRRPLVLKSTTGQTCMAEPMLGSRVLAWQEADSDGDVVVACDAGLCWVPAGEFLVDLTSRTSRVHAAWWAKGRVEWPLLGNSSMEALELARGGKDMTPNQIETLRDMVRRLWLEEVSDAG